MLIFPQRALIIRKSALTGLGKTGSELIQLLAFEKPYAETRSLIVYGPYFDFESLEEVCQRLGRNGLEYWDDFFDLKEDIPMWLSFGILDSPPPSRPQTG